MSINYSQQVTASARTYRDSLSRTDPSRYHLSALLDVIAAMRAAAAEDGRRIATLYRDLRAANSDAEETLRITMPPAAELPGYDANGSPEVVP